MDESKCTVRSLLREIGNGAQKGTNKYIINWCCEYESISEKEWKIYTKSTIY